MVSNTIKNVRSFSKKYSQPVKTILSIIKAHYGRLMAASVTESVYDHDVHTSVEEGLSMSGVEMSVCALS